MPDLDQDRTRPDPTPDATARTGSAPDRALRQAQEAVALEWKPGDVILDLYRVLPVREGWGEAAREKNYHQGGFGRVYRVLHQAWNLELAVKTPRSEAFQTPEQEDDFTRECEAWIGLGLHPHIASCFYVRRLGGVPRVFAEYLSGGSLKDWIDSGRLYSGDREKTLKTMLDIALQTARGLGYAHEQGLVHQDVKPANVLLAPEGLAKVADFGLAKSFSEAGYTRGGITGAGTMVGSVPYMAPEHLVNYRYLQPATDVFEMAATFYHLLSGTFVWDFRDGVEPFRVILEEAPEPLRSRESSVPRKVAEVIDRALSRKAEERYSDGGEFLEALRREL